MSILIALALSWIVGLNAAGVIGTAVCGGTTVGALPLGSDTNNAVTVDGNSALGRLAAMDQRPDEANKELQQAQRSGHTNAQSAAMGKTMRAISGTGGSVEALRIRSKPFCRKAWAASGAPASPPSATIRWVCRYPMPLPNTAMRRRADLARSNRHRRRQGLCGNGGRDGAEGVKADRTQLREDLHSDGHVTHEQWDSQSRQGEYSVVLSQRFTVKANGHADSIDQLKPAVASGDLAKLESIKDVGVKSN